MKIQIFLYLEYDFDYSPLARSYPNEKFLLLRITVRVMSTESLRHQKYIQNGIFKISGGLCIQNMSQIFSKNLITSSFG